MKRMWFFIKAKFYLFWFWVTELFEEKDTSDDLYDGLF